MQKFQNNIQDQFGNEITLPTITVRNVVGGALSTIFSDNLSTPLANPFIAQDLSEFFFYAANNRYDIFITGPVTDSSLDVLLFDQADFSTPTPIDLLDNEQIRFGTGQDTLLFFDGLNFVMQAVAGNLTFDGEMFGTGSLYLTEKAAAGADTVTLGQFWVRNDVPNVAMFTDDAGTDFVLNAGGGGNVIKVGIPVDNQIGVWTGDGTIEGDSNLTWTGTVFEVGGTIQVSNTSGPALLNEVSSNINPTLIPNNQAPSSGLGGIAGQPSLIANGKSGMSVSEAGGAAKIGFYDRSPIFKQTGVSVTTAAVHAALVSLGLIAA